MMEMSARNKYGDPLIVGDHDIIVPNRERGCTDVICLGLFLILLGGFIGLMAYGVIKGDPGKILDVYNTGSSRVRCSTTQYSYGYFTDPGSVENAICVKNCPTSDGQHVQCLIDSLCKTGIYTNTQQTFQFDNYCVPDTGNISNFFNQSALQSWASDLGRGWPVLLAAAAAAMILSMLFMLFVRCCAGVVIWVMIIIGLIGIQLVGIMMILEAKGVKISPYINSHIESVSYDTLIIVGSCLIVSGVLLLVLVVCLKSRISQGIKAVQIGAIFIFENCCIVLMPVTQAIFVVSAIAATVAGVIYLYSLGTLSFQPDNAAFPDVSLSDGQKIMVAFCIGGGVWTMFFFHGCNHYMMCSAVAVWYFNHESAIQGSPFSDSLMRLIRFNLGSVAITSLINGILFVLKLIVQILSFEAKDDDHCLVSACIKCMNCFLCLCKTLIRFLNDSVYVHIAVYGTNYCSSCFRAFNLVTDNIVKVAITDGISIFFTVLGVLGITAGITVGAYFACIRIEYLARLLTNPVIVTIGSGIIAFVIACLYLSMIDISAQAALQCYFIDHEAGGGRTKYAKNRLKDVLEE